MSEENLEYKSEDHICYICNKEINKLDWSVVMFVDGKSKDAHTNCIVKGMSKEIKNCFECRNHKICKIYHGLYSKLEHMSFIEDSDIFIQKLSNLIGEHCKSYFKEREEDILESIPL